MIDQTIVVQAQEVIFLPRRSVLARLGLSPNPDWHELNFRFWVKAATRDKPHGFWTWPFLAAILSWWRHPGRWPDRFIGTTDIDYDLARNERHLESELETLTKAVQETGFRGLCPHLPKGQPRDDPRCDRLWKTCTRLKIPVFLETGFNAKRTTSGRLEKLKTSVAVSLNCRSSMRTRGATFCPPAIPTT